MTLAAPAIDPLPLIVDGVSVRYGRRLIVDRVSLRLHRGEIYGLLGPNGAGKSTLIRAICGRLALERGRIFIDGERIEPLSGPSPVLGRVAQRAALFDHMSVRENLFTFGRVFGLGGRDLRTRVEATLERLGLTSIVRSRADRLSGGQRQRLHIAVALLTSPKVLMLDEPTVGVDLASRRSLYDLLAELKAEGLAIVLTTHDLPEARLLADRIGILIRGKLVTEGTPEALIDARFRHVRHVRICVRSDAPAENVKLLDAIGLTRTGATFEWTGLVDEAEALPRLFNLIQQGSDLVTDVVLTRPDLGALLSAWDQGEPASDATPDEGRIEGGAP